MPVEYVAAMPAVNRRARRCVATLAVIAGLVTGPVGGVAATSGASAHDELTARLARARNLLALGTLGDAVRAAAAAVRVPVDAPAATALAPATSTAPLLPAPLPATIADLLAAVDRAERRASEALLVRREELLRAQNRLLAALSSARVDDAEARTELGGLSDPGGMVDRSRLYSAAVTLAEALDRALPALQRLPTGARSVRAEPCDMVNQPPVLCVGGTGASTYDASYTVVIDLGGDDVHTHAAGGANPLGDMRAVAVTIDLGGNDVYRNDTATAAVARVVQGSGFLGGIGMLVDADGDDRYQATSPTTQSVYAQGTGAAGGVGVLADLGGDDAYSIRNVAPAAGGPGYRVGQGQAVASIGGAGLLLDQGGGDDDYVIESTPVPAVDTAGVLQGADAQITGQGGAAAGGAAILFDSGGVDDMTLRAVSGPIPPDAPQPVGRVSAAIWGQGYGGLGATGFSISGDGPTTRAVEVVADGHRTSEGPISPTASTSAIALGIGLLGGYGAVHDAGGDDAYFSDLTTRSVRRVTAARDCGCPGVTATATARGALAQVMGIGSFGVGLLHDAEGNDLYRSSARSLAVAEARDEREVPPAPPPPDELPVAAAGAEATAGTAISRAQGVGFGGAGVLEDLGGNDVYESVTQSRADATATSLLPGALTDATALAERASSLAQGAADAGTGQLLDRGGTDRYATSNVSEAAALPPNVASTGPTISSIQGSVDTAGVASFSDVGGVEDVFAAVPQDAACTGRRGDAAWLDCGPGAGTGSNT